VAEAQQRQRRRRQRRQRGRYHHHLTARSRAVYSGDVDGWLTESSSRAWLAAAADTGAGAITAATAAHPAVRVAVGPLGTGVDGFRRSHFDAVATQRLMSRRPDLRVARFADVQLVTLAIADEQRAREFVARTLGTLADADRELRDTLCVYIGEQFSAARALYTHRNTVLNRLQRAERLLPLPLAGHGLEVGVALEIAQWLGTQPGSVTRDR